jgi:hypothetical protein
MSTLESSIRMKTNAAKGPAVTGLMPANPPENARETSGGHTIENSKALKNAGMSAESRLSEKVRAVNQKLEAKGYSLPSIQPGTQDKVNNRF